MRSLEITSDLRNRKEFLLEDLRAHVQKKEFYSNRYSGNSMAGEAAVASLGIVFGLLMLVVICLAIAAMAFWILMVVDCATRKLSDGERIAWILILIFTGALGAAIYYFVVKRRR